MVHVAETLDLRFEVQVETPQSILGPDGTALVARMVHAGGERLTGLHYGTYDYSAFVGIVAAYQSLEHPVADHAKLVMQAAAAGTGVRLSDGSTNRLPIGDRDTVVAAWANHHRLVRRSLEHGYYQGWDLHPAQLPTRYAATYAFYREGLASARRPARGVRRAPTRARDRRRAGDGPRAGAVRAPRAWTAAPWTPPEVPGIPSPASLGSRGWELCWEPNQYGKAENRVVRIVRDTPVHEIRDLNVSTSLRGDFAAAHITGDQSEVLPTDTQKNTAFAYAKIHGDRLDRGLRTGPRPPAHRGHAGRHRGRGADRGVRLGPDRRPLVRPPRRRGAHLRRHGRPRRPPASSPASRSWWCSTRPTPSSRASSRTSSRPCPRPTTGSWPPRWWRRWRHAGTDRRLERLVRRSAGRHPRDLRQHLLPRAAGVAVRDGHRGPRGAARHRRHLVRRRPTSTTSSSTSPASRSTGLDQRRRGLHRRRPALRADRGDGRARRSRRRASRCSAASPSRAGPTTCWPGSRTPGGRRCSTRRTPRPGRSPTTSSPRRCPATRGSVSAGERSRSRSSPASTRPPATPPRGSRPATRRTSSGSTGSS